MTGFLVPCGGDVDLLEILLQHGNVVIGDSHISSQKVCSKHSCLRKLENWEDRGPEITQSYPRIIPTSLIVITLTIFSLHLLLLLLLPLILATNRQHHKCVGLKTAVI